MNIWIINQYVGVPTGGVGNRHFSLGRKMVERGHSVVVVASGYSHRTRREEVSFGSAPWTTAAYYGVDFVWVRVPAYRDNGLDRVYSMVKFGIATRSTQRKWGIKPPDVVVGSSPHLFAALAAERIARSYGVPFVLEIRDLWPQTFIELGGYPSWHPAIWSLERVERYLYRRADAIISLLPGAADHLVMKGADRTKITWIPNGVDLSLMPLPTSPPTRDEFVVMYAGAHGRANALDSIIEAAAILGKEAPEDGIRFRFLGEGPEKSRLEQRCVAEGLNMVGFEPFVPRSRALEIMQEADAFIVTLCDSNLYRYGMSLNKIYDYMASARPVVFGARSLNNPVEASGAGVVVEPENAQEMARAVQHLARLPLEERWTMGLAGRRYVEDRHDYASLAEQLEGVLFRVAPASSGGRRSKSTA
jgi:glycosyltransferase involved in cell wall biosynthesis